MRILNNIKILTIPVIFVMLSSIAFAAEKSIFNSKVGQYQGTLNGLLILQMDENENTNVILDFQSSNLSLNVVPDEHKIYDTNYKYYDGFTTSGKTEIKYSTYSNANAFEIVLNRVKFQVSTMDGGYNQKVQGIETKYFQDENTEYLILRFIDDVIMTNNQQVLSDFYKANPGDNDPIKYKTYIKGKKKSLKVDKDSILIFTIKK